MSYVPIPFARSLRVVADGPVAFYHFTWTRFADGTVVESFEPAAGFVPAFVPPPRGEALAVTKSWIGANGRPIPTFAPIEFPHPIEPGHALRVEARGPAAVTETSIFAESDDPAYLRTTVARIWFDGETTPSVEAPLGDLFGIGFHGGTHASLPLTAAPPGFRCRFVMPFHASMRLEIENASREADASIRVDAALNGVAGPVDAFGGVTFRARFRRELTRAGRPVRVLSARGSGHFVGLVLTAKGPRGITYLEGDEQIQVDGRSIDAYHGTGTEDYFNGGWYFRGGPFLRPLHGVTHLDGGRGEVCAYRFHVPDAIPFRESIAFDLEHGGGNDEPGVEYGLVAYWYGTRDDDGDLERLDERTIAPPRRVLGYDRPAIHAREMGGGGGPSLPLEVLSETECGPIYAIVESTRELHVPIDVADRYRVTLLAAREPGASTATVSIGDLEKVVACHADTFTPLVELPLGVTRLDRGAARLMVTNDGGSRILIEGVRIEPELPFVTEYHVAGPLPLDEGNGFERYPPPSDEWRPVDAGPDGFLDLYHATRGAQDAVGFASFVLDAKTARDVVLRIGSDDWVAVSLDGEEVHRHVIHRAPAPDQDLVRLSLRAGENRVVVRVANEDGGFGMFARVSDPIGGLILRRR